uniref:F-box associated beta-propeller type 3 domain-containing protein n=1 Tax=Leersia perrieri TaxID=77586 RepID=A0A0D9XKT2_9ORYZ
METTTTNIGDGAGSDPHPRDDRTLCSWVAKPLGHLSRALPGVLPSSLAEGDVPIKLFFTPAAVSQDDNFFYACHPGGQIKKLPYAAGAFPEGALVSPVTKPLHGIVLLRCWPPPPMSFGYFVCKPCTGDVLPLPDSSSPMKMAERRHFPGSTHNYVRYGLGYCSTSNKYKVVRLFCLVDDVGAVTTSCEVFVLDESLCWRPAAGQSPPCEFFWNTMAAVFWNGSLHFLSDDSSSIVTFNVCDESFGSLSPPSLKLQILKLTVLDGDYGGEAARWEMICCIDVAAWPRGTLEAPDLSLMPLGLLHGGGSGKRQEILFGSTNDHKVFTAQVACDGTSSSRPKVVFSPYKTVIGDYHHHDAGGLFPLVGLLDESAAATPVGRTSEELVFSSPSSNAWAEILKTLPARQVARLKLVCRDVRAMIDTDRFVALHAVNANLNRWCPRIMFVKQCNYFGATFMSLEKLVGASSSEMPPPFTDGGSRIVCSMPCHGLNVGSYGRGGDFLCNPATGFYRRIDREDGACSIGLGYNLVANKHVLVRLRHKYNNNTDIRSLECLVRPVEEDGAPVYASGKLHWMARSHAQPEGSPSPTCEIHAFDIGTGSFEVLRGPPCSPGPGGGHTSSLLELRGELCLARMTSRSTNVTMEVWTGNGNGAWLMEHRVELGGRFSSEDTTALHVHPMDGRIYLSTGRALGVYDPITAALETIYSLQSDDDGIDKRFTPILYHESLVWPFNQSHRYHAKKSWSDHIQSAD